MGYYDGRPGDLVKIPYHIRLNSTATRVINLRSLLVLTSVFSFV